MAARRCRGSATLLGEILEAAVSAGARYDVPVTMKTRKGIDDDHLTYLDAGRIAQESGVAAIALHGRTAIQGYSGAADWDAIARLVEHVDIPVLGNGDIWEAADALRMVEQTGADGVVVGRGCLGRPWLFRDLARGVRRRARRDQPCPRLGEVSAMMRRHAELLAGTWGRSAAARSSASTSRGTSRASRSGATCAASLALVSTLAELDGLLGRARPGRGVPGRRAGHAAGSPGQPAQGRGAARGVAGRHRRHRFRRTRGRVGDHRRLTPRRARDQRL